ncbi:MAG: hypothetical protein IT395_05605 [Candidatus Omnitrophica bacterium]|nr:hypothetical protein [Candidatus Omnitrophota bacterium]
MPIIILLLLLFSATPSFAEPQTITTTQCAELGGEIINTLEQKGCEPPSGYLGTVTGVRCPCICCKRADTPKAAPDYSATIIYKDGHEVSADTVIVTVRDGVTSERVEEIAEDIGGHARIIGLEIGAYEIVIPTVKDAAELDAIMKKLRAYREVEHVEANGITRLDEPPNK